MVELSSRLRIVASVLVGIATIGYGAYSYSVQSSALDAEATVNATVVSTSVEKNAKRKGDSYTPKATFRYSYDGETYTSSNVYPGTLPREFGSKAEAKSELAGYEPGDTVTAYVSPDSPGSAYLKRTKSNKPFLVIGFGTMFLLGGLYSAFRN